MVTGKSSSLQMALPNSNVCKFQLLQNGKILQKSIVLRAQEELEETLQRTQSAWMYYSSEKDRLEKYFFMFEKSGSQNKKPVLKSDRIAQSRM